MTVQSTSYQNPNIVVAPAAGSNGSPRIRCDIDSAVSQIKNNINPGALNSATDMYLSHGLSTADAAADGQQFVNDMKAFLANPSQGDHAVVNDLELAGYSSANADQIASEIASGQSVVQPGDTSSDNTPT